MSGSASISSRSVRSESTARRAAEPDELVCPAVAKPLSERKRDALGHDQASCRVEIPTHSGCVHLEPVERVADRRRGPTRVGESSGQRLPLGLPGAGRSLVLGIERAREHERVAAYELGARASQDGANRVALVRHGGGAATRRLSDFRDFSLGEQREIKPDLGQNAGGDLQRASELGDADTVRVPGNDRLW